MSIKNTLETIHIYYKIRYNIETVEKLVMQKKIVNVTKSEEIFENYLLKHKIDFDRNYPVGTKNVDFYISTSKGNIISDVKEVQNTKKEEIDACDYIKEDIKKLRQKFKTKPLEPVLLVTFNNSSRFFTGFTVARAMLGDIGLTFDKKTMIKSSDIHFIIEGNASLTSKKNCSISGVFVLQEHKKNYLFLNPYANYPLSNNLFPDTEILELTRNLQGDDLKILSEIMIY